MDGSPYGQENYFPVGPGYDGADEDLWDWRCLGRVDNLSQGTHTLNLWAGGAGFDVDRIVIQTRDDGSCSNDSSPPDSPDGYPRTMDVPIGLAIPATRASPGDRAGSPAPITAPTATSVVTPISGRTPSTTTSSLSGTHWRRPSTLSAYWTPASTKSATYGIPRTRKSRMNWSVRGVWV